MSRLRSILGLIAGLVLAGARPQLGAATVTGSVVNAWGIAQTNVPVTFTPFPAQQPRAVGGGAVMTGTGVRTLTDSAGGFSAEPLPGFYSVQIGALATKAWLIEVGTNAGTFDWTSLVTTNSGLGFPTNGYPFLLARLGDVSLGTPANNHVLAYDAPNGVWTNKAGGAGGGVTAHNELTGLDADDHPQYQLRSELGASNAVAVATANAYTTTATNSLASWIASNFQLATAFLTEWGLLDPDDYSTTAEANAAYQPLGSYATTNTFGGATSGSAGSVGLVPRPVAGDEGKFLRGDGTWASGGGGGVTDHGGLTGLGDDDHPQYLLRSQTNLVQQLAFDYTDSEISALSSVYQPLDSDLTAWASVNPSSYLTTSAAASAYQPLDTDLTAWAAVNPSSYSTTAQIAAGYQPLDADLTAWAAVNPSAYLTTASAASSYQPLDSDLTAWAAVNPSAYLTTSSAAATYQPIGTYATPADIAGATNRNHLRITNNVASVVHVLSAASNATNYVLNIAQREQLVDVTGNVRFVGFSGDLTGYGLGGSIMLSNGTGSAYTVEFTNTWKALRGHTNTIPANGVSWVGWKARSGRISYGAVPEQ